MTDRARVLIVSSAPSPPGNSAGTRKVTRTQAAPAVVEYATTRGTTPTGKPGTTTTPLRAVLRHSVLCSGTDDVIGWAR
jgi:hypothetical protein